MTKLKFRRRAKGGYLYGPFVIERNNDGKLVIKRDEQEIASYDTLAEAKMAIERWMD